MSKILTFLFLLSVFVLTFLPTKDSDFGWHYRCGKEFIESGNVCTNNTFSYFLANYRSFNSHLLYDIGLVFFYDNFGFLGVSFAGSVIMTLSAYIFILIGGTTWYSFTFFYLMFFLSSLSFSSGIRSQTLTYFYFLLVFFICEKAKNSKSWLLYVLPIIFLLWTNTHLGFFVGLLVVFLFSINNVLKKEYTLLIVFLFSFLATFINPFGISVYKEIANHIAAPLNKMIVEWASPSILENLLIIIFTISAIVFTLIRKTGNICQSLLLLLFGFLAFKASRNLVFFYTIFFLTLAKILDSFNMTKAKVNTICAVSLIFIITFFSFTQVPKTISFSHSWKEYCLKGIVISYPCTAFEKYPQLSGNVFTLYEWGGFFIWKKPQMKVFIDGRMSTWKDENEQYAPYVFLNILLAQPGWNEKLNKLKTDYILIGSGVELDNTIKKRPELYKWGEVYRDQQAVIYKNIALEKSIIVQ